MPAVLHVSASFPRRADDPQVPFLLDLLRVQRAAGWSATAVGLHDPGLPIHHEVDGVPVRRARYGPDRWEVLGYRGGLIHALRRGLAALLVPVLLLSLAWSARREARRLHPDVVHGHWIVPGGLAVALLPRRLRPRSVLTVHGTDAELAGGRLRPVARWICRRVDRVVAASEPLARRTEEQMGLPAGSVGVARLPLAAGLVPSPIPPGSPRSVLAAARASREKGLDVLVAALALPAAEGAIATLVAEGPELPALEAQVAAAGLGDRVRFHPLVPHQELFRLIADHQVVAVPSRREGLGLVALEAIALGRPVVASAVGGLPDVVAHGVDGLLVPAEDPVALARALATVPLVAPTALAAAPHRADAVVAAHAELYGFGA